MAINALWNRRCGPGGGTRRLHHFHRFEGNVSGETRYDVAKIVTFKNRSASVLLYVRTESEERRDLQPVRVRFLHGGETGSTRVVKIEFLPGMIPPLSGHFTNANDNVDMSEVRAAA